MDHLDLVCAMLRTLASRHQYGSPIRRDALVRLAGVPSHRRGDARDAFEALRNLGFLHDGGRLGVQAVPARFGALIAFLHDTCGVGEMELRTRFHHFEGWDDLDLG